MNKKVPKRAPSPAKNEVLDEKPDLVALRPEDELFGVDPEVFSQTFPS